MRRALSLSGQAFLAAFSFAASTARGADISVAPGQGSDPALVTLIGRLELGDIDAFNTQIAPLSKAIVAFSSPGGNLIAGIRIGEQIRMKGFSTLVLDNVSCASACALAWLGGARRFMGPQARIGFHAASIVKDGEAQTTSSGNALTGAYLNRIGLPDKAIFFVTDPAPNEIRWLTMEDAAQQGIEVSLLTLSRPNPPETPTGEAALSADDEATVERLSRNFRARLAQAGVGGLPESVAACYEQAAASGGEGPAIYCLALDRLALRWSGQNLSAWDARAADFLQRVAAGGGGDQWLARALAVAGESYQRLRN